MMSQLFTIAWSLYFTGVTWLHSTVPGEIFTQGIQRSMPPQDVHSQICQSVPFSVALLRPAAQFICQTTRIQAEHGFHNNNFWWASSPLYFQVCMTVGRGISGVPRWAMVNGAEQTLLKFLPWLAETGGRLRDGQTGRRRWITWPGMVLSRP